VSRTPSLVALAGLKVLSGVGSMAAACWRWMVGSAEVVCAVALMRRIHGSGLIRAKRPGEDAFVKTSKGCG
jgi:hypothetical protein